MLYKSAFLTALLVPLFLVFRGYKQQDTSQITQSKTKNAKDSVTLDIAYVKSKQLRLLESGERQLKKNKNNSDVNKDRYVVKYNKLGPAKVIYVGFKHEHTCVINIFKLIYCWGANTEGELGYGDKTQRKVANRDLPPVDIGLDRIPEVIYTGEQFSCVLLESKDVLCWGRNDFGQLGLGHKNSIGDSPSELGDALQTIDFGAGRKVKQLECTYYDCCVILDNDLLKCWGKGINGLLGYEESNNKGDNPDEMGDNLPYVNFGAGVKVHDISKAKHNSCVLTNIGVKCWGDINWFGQLGYGDTIDRGLAVGSMGDNLPVVDVGSEGTPVKVRLGHQVGCVIFDIGTAKCWGEDTLNFYYPNFGGKLGQESSTERRSAGDDLPMINFGTDVKVVDINGYNGFFAIMDDGRVKGWGVSYGCSLPTLGNTYGSTLGAEYTGIGRLPGSMGDNLPYLDFPGGRTVRMVRTGSYGSCVVFTDDTLTCFGGNGQGQLGRTDEIGSVGCKEGEMGDFLELVELYECPLNYIEIDVNTDSNPTGTSYYLKSLNLDEIVMESRDGEYTMPNTKYEHKACEPHGTYEIKIEHSLGEWEGSFDITLNQELLRSGNVSGYFYEDKVMFSSCVNDTHCDDQVFCTRDTCNLDTKTCEFKPHYSTECRSFGEPITLVIRGSSLDSQLNTTTDELRDNFFGSSGKAFNMRTQYDDCSYGIFNMTPFNSTEGIGVMDIMLDQNTNGMTSSAVADLLHTKAQQDLGQSFTDLEQLGYVIICVPPGTRVGDSYNWKAYAYIDNYLSIYNGENCAYTSVQMHEIGHNIGLSHSNDEENYGDHSGMMGLSYSLSDGPFKCFNGAKSYQLGWYPDSFIVVDLEKVIGREVQLVGISEMELRKYKATHLKLVNCQNGYDYYFAFNRNTGINRETAEGINEVLVTQRVIGSYYANSILEARLGHLQKFTIYGLGANGDIDLQITPNIYTDEVPGYARISFSTWESGCTEENSCDDDNFCTIDECAGDPDSLVCIHTPKICSDCGAPVTIDVLTDDYPQDLVWNIRNMLSGRIVQASEYYVEKFTAYNFSDCFEYGQYKFAIAYDGNATMRNESASYNISLGDLIIDDGILMDLISTELIFTICAVDSDCQDYDGCTIDRCNLATNMCNNIQITNEAECIACSFMNLDVIPDNFADETAWNLFESVDALTEFLILSGDPYPMDVTANGRRKAPTKSGRRKAPTRSSAGVNSPSRKLQDDDDNISRRICIQENIKVSFRITDTFGDGICCAEGEGEYRIYGNDKLLQRGGNYSYVDELVLKFTGSADECEDHDPSTVHVYDPVAKTCLYYPVDCEVYGAMVNVLIKADIYADDINWYIASSAKDELKGGKYVLAYTDYPEAKCLPFGTYSFVINDSGADGMAFCFDNECGYKVSINNRTVTESDGSYDFKRSHAIGVCTTDDHCDDEDDCTEDSCDVVNRACIFAQKPCADCGKETVSFDVNTDFLFSLTSWTTTNNETGELIISGGPFVKAFTHYQQIFCFSSGYFNFTMKNNQGRGLTLCETGDCGYSVSVNDYPVIESDGSFSYEKSDIFIICYYDNQCEDHDPCTNTWCDIDTKTCRSVKLTCSQCDKESVTLSINTDAAGPQTSWDLTQDGSLVANGGKYARNHTMYQEEYCFTAGVYNFTISDSFGNGLVECDVGTCGYSITINGEIVIEEDGSFMERKTHLFGICNQDADCDDDDACTQDSCILASKTCQFDLVCADCGKKQVVVDVNTDGKPEESSWFLMEKLDSSIVAAGGVFAQDFTNYNDAYCLPGGEYVLKFVDETGDGMSDCPSNDCGYSLTVDGTEIANSAGSFSNYTIDEFGVDAPPPNATETIFGESESFATTTALAVGYHHTCALTKMDFMFCWGENNFGQLGYGDKVNRPQTGSEFIPISFVGIKIKDVRAGAYHTCALTDSNDLICWGCNDEGQLGYETREEVTMPIMRDDNYTTVNLGEGRKVKKFSMGYKHTCAILDNDKLKCWGDNDKGQLGYDHKYNRGDDKDEMGDKLFYVDLGNEGVLKDVSTGTYHTCALLSTGVKCFGNNDQGQLGYGDKVSRSGRLSMGFRLPVVDMGGTVSKIYAGNSVTCALFDDAKAKCFGFNVFGQLGYGDTEERGGDIGEMGANLPYIDIGDGIQITDLAVGSYSICALTSSETVKCWGWNYECTLGSGDNIDRNKPLQMGNNLPIVDFGGRKAVAIAMAHVHSCIIADDGGMPCWGYNKHGELGHGDGNSLGCNPVEMGENLLGAKIYDPVSWLMKVDSVSAIDSVHGIDVKYNLSKSLTPRQVGAIIYDKTCSEISNDTSIYVDEIRIDVQPDILDKANVNVGVDYTRIRSSPFWSDISVTKGAYEFCVVSELYFDNTQADVITMTETMIASYVDFEGNFNITDIHVTKKEALDVYEGSHFQLEACLCNEEHVCDSSPMIHQDADIMLCVHPHHELRVSKFQDVNFYQDGILKFKAVENGEGKLLTTTSIEGEYGVLQTRLVADFFRTPNPSAAHVTGEVYLDFRDHISGRSLLENQQASFSLNLLIRKNSKEIKSGSFGYGNILMVVVVALVAFLLKKKRKNKHAYSLVETQEI